MVQWVSLRKQSQSRACVMKHSAAPSIKKKKNSLWCNSGHDHSRIWIYFVLISHKCSYIIIRVTLKTSAHFLFVLVAVFNCFLSFLARDNFFGFFVFSRVCTARLPADFFNTTRMGVPKKKKKNLKKGLKWKRHKKWKFMWLLNLNLVTLLWEDQIKRVSLMYPY